MENIFSLQESSSLFTYHGYSLPTKMCYRKLKDDLIESYPTLLLVENDQVIIPGWSAALHLLWKHNWELTEKFSHFPDNWVDATRLAELGEKEKLWKICVDPETWCQKYF